MFDPLVVEGAHPSTAVDTWKLDSKADERGHFPLCASKKMHAHVYVRDGMLGGQACERVRASRNEGVLPAAGDRSSLKPTPPGQY